MALGRGSSGGSHDELSPGFVYHQTTAPHGPNNKHKGGTMAAKAKKTKASKSKTSKPKAKVSK